MQYDRKTQRQITKESTYTEMGEMGPV